MQCSAELFTRRYRHVELAIFPSHYPLTDENLWGLILQKTLVDPPRIDLSINDDNDDDGNSDDDDNNVVVVVVVDDDDDDDEDDDDGEPRLHPFIHLYIHMLHARRRSD
jgi:hypothetical protein